MKTVLVAYPGCIFLEVAHAVSVLKEKTDIVVATPKGRPVKVGEGHLYRRSESPNRRSLWPLNITEIGLCQQTLIKNAAHFVKSADSDVFGKFRVKQNPK